MAAMSNNTPFDRAGIKEKIVVYGGLSRKESRRAGVDGSAAIHFLVLVRHLRLRLNWVS